MRIRIWLAIVLAFAALFASLAAPGAAAPNVGTAASVGTASGVPAAETAPGVTLGNVTYDGPGVVWTNASQTYLWKSERFVVNGSFASTNGGAYEFCLTSETENGTRELACKTSTVESEQTTTISFKFKNATPLDSKQNVSLRVRRAFNDTAVVASDRARVTVIRKDGDLDGDGLPNQEELKRGTKLNRQDSDGDTLGDGAEVNQYGTDPADADSDDDGLSDAAELSGSSGSVTEPLDADSDGDGLIDGKEVNEYGTDPTKKDSDGDGLDDRTEISLGTDPNAKDSDNDGINDKKELERGTNATNANADTDGDGLLDTKEVELGTDPKEVDTDGDGIPDKREVALGTNPTNSSTVTVIVGLGFLLVVGVFGSAYRFGPPAVRRLLDSAEGDSPTRGGSEESASTPTNQRSDSPSGVAGGSPAAPNPQDASLNGDPVGPSPAPAPTFEDVEPITDEDRVLKLLSEHGGRMKQGDINGETDWSKSKVSRLLSRMEDEGKIRKITLGRENLVALEGHVPESAESPFDVEDDEPDDGDDSEE